jgi:hypothetical protein
VIACAVKQRLHDSVRSCDDTADVRGAGTAGHQPWPQCAFHCAFLVSEPEFDAAFARIRTAGIPYCADPYRERAGEINHLYSGPGVYFEDPAVTRWSSSPNPTATQPSSPAPVSLTEPEAPAQLGRPREYLVANRPKGYRHTRAGRRCCGT